MNILKKALTAIVTLLLGTGCNSDVFIDDFLPKPVSPIVLNACDSVTIPFNAPNWEIQLVQDEKAEILRGSIHYLDGQTSTNGFFNYIKGCAILEYQNNLFDFKIVKDQYKRLKVIFGENLYDIPRKLQISVGNDYKDETLYIGMPQTPKYKIDSISYHFEQIKHQNSPKEDIFTATYKNSSNDTIKINIMPANYAVEKVQFNGAIDLRTIQQIFGKNTTEVAIPSWINHQPRFDGKKSAYDPQEKEIPFAQSTPPKEIAIPPMKSKIILIEADVDTYEVPYELHLSNPSTKRTRTLKGVYIHQVPKNFKLYVSIPFEKK